MTDLTPKPPVKLLVGLYAAEPSLIDELTGRLALEFGPIRLRSARWPDEAAGVEPLTRQWAAFEETFNPVNFPGVKCHALRVEQLYADIQGRPRVRLDVAYLDPLRVVRATAADAPHRLYLGAGIFGEVILHWREGVGFAPLPWTRAWDRTPGMLDFLERVREDWLFALRQDARQPDRE